MQSWRLVEPAEGGSRSSDYGFLTGRLQWDLRLNRRQWK